MSTTDKEYWLEEAERAANIPDWDAIPTSCKYEAALVEASLAYRHMKEIIASGEIHETLNKVLDPSVEWFNASISNEIGGFQLVVQDGKITVFSIQETRR